MSVEPRQEGIDKRECWVSSDLVRKTFDVVSVLRQSDPQILSYTFFVEKYMFVKIYNVICFSCSTLSPTSGICRSFGCVSQIFTRCIRLLIR